MGLVDNEKVFLLSLGIAQSDCTGLREWDVMWIWAASFHKPTFEIRTPREFWLDHPPNIDDGRNSSFVIYIAPLGTTPRQGPDR